MTSEYIQSLVVLKISRQESHYEHLRSLIDTKEDFIKRIDLGNLYFMVPYNAKLECKSSPLTTFLL